MDAGKKVGFALGVLFVAMVLLCLQSPVCAANAADKGDETMGHGSAVDIVVAKVNGSVINMDQLMRTMSHISRTKHGSQEVSPLLAEKIKQEAIDKLVIEELAAQVAGAKIKVTAEQIEAKIQAIKQKYKSEDAFQKYVQNDFNGIDGLRKLLQRSLPLELFIAQEFDAKVTVSDQEVQQAYDAAKAQSFVTEEFVQVNDLLFFLDPVAPESEASIEKIKKSIAEQYNNDPSQFPAEGTYTLQKNRPLDKVKDKALYDAARGLKEYGWSTMVNVDGNLHVVQLVGFKSAVNKSLPEVAPQLKKQVRQQKLQGLINTWMAGLKEGATIEVMDLTR